MATLAISLAAKAASPIASIFLGQHSARLKNATSENQMADEGIPAFDQDLQEIVQAWNSGQYDAPTIVSLLQSLDSKMRSYFNSMAGKPGVAWTNYTQEPSQICNKSCTVGCCFYWYNVHIVTSGIIAIISGQAIPRGGFGQNVAKSPVQNGYAQVTVGQVYPSKYSSFTRPAYQLPVRLPNAPAPGGSPVSVLQSIESGLGIGSSPSTASGSAGIAPVVAAVAASKSPTVSGGSSVKWLALAALVLFALILFRSK